MSAVTNAAELARLLEIAHENVAKAEAEVERALREIETRERSDKRLISTALREAFERLAVTRRELETALASVR